MTLLVSGVIGREGSPALAVLRSFIDGQIEAVVDSSLLDEYRDVLSRERTERFVGAGPLKPEVLLGFLTRVALTPSPPAPERAPDPEDQHLWDLLFALPDAILVTGDRLLLAKPPEGTIVVSPREFMERYLS